MNLTDLPTPSLILDRAILQRNLDAMHRRLAERGVALRPHLKTAKSAKVAALATAGQEGGITVSTLAEVEYFLNHGYRDILYAVGIAEGRLGRVAALRTAGADLKIVTDSVDTAGRIVAYAAQRDATFRVLIEVDSGEGRAGVLPEGPELLEIGRILHAGNGVELAGVLTHAGHSYGCRSVKAIEAIAETERTAITQAADRLRKAGLPCPIVSAGSTPTAVHARNLDGVTEMRPGVFVFNDLKQLSVGSCRREDLALTVLGSVIGHNRHRGHVILDTGALALSKDISAHDAWPTVGYGEVCDPLTLNRINALCVASVSQEHGIVPVRSEDDFRQMPIGAKVRILPNHACITAAGYDRYRVLENGAITEEWDRINGW